MHLGRRQETLQMSRFSHGSRSEYPNGFCVRVERPRLKAVKILSVKVTAPNWGLWGYSRALSGGDRVAWALRSKLCHSHKPQTFFSGLVQVFKAGEKKVFCPNARLSTFLGKCSSNVMFQGRWSWFWGKPNLTVFFCVSKDSSCLSNSHLVLAVTVTDIIISHEIRWGHFLPL